jgi:hypothetical protein
LKKDNRALEKFSSVVIALLAHAFILDATKSGNNIGNKNISSNIAATVIPNIFKTLKRILLKVVFMFWLQHYLLSQISNKPERCENIFRCNG